MDSIFGCARTERTREKALELGIVDAMFENAGETVAGADLGIICSHLWSYPSVGEAMSSHLTPGAIVTDVGSVKGCVVRDLGPHIPQGVHLVPGHPVSGSEKSGPEAGFEALFDDRWWILTPGADADQDAPKDGLLRGFLRIKMDVLTEFQLSGFTYLIHSPSFEVNGNRTDQGV